MREAIMLQKKNPIVMSTAECPSCLRIRMVAIAHIIPERIPNQSPTFLGMGKFRPKPKMINIPINARMMARMRCHVMLSLRIMAANNVLQTGVK